MRPAGRAAREIHKSEKEAAVAVAAALGARQVLGVLSASLRRLGAAAGGGQSEVFEPAVAAQGVGLSD